MIDRLMDIWDNQWVTYDRTNSGLLANIAALVLILLLVGPGSAATIEYFQSPPTHTGFTRITDTYANIGALTDDVEAEANGTWSGLSDVDKVWNICTFVRKHMLVSQTGAVSISTAGTTTTNVYENFTTMANNGGGVMCGGAADLFLFLASQMGFETYHISAGHYPEWTHSFCLVRVSVEGHYKMILYDPYFGDMYTYTNGTPMSFFVMQDLIASDDLDQINRRAIGQSYDTWCIAPAGFEMYDETDWSGTGLNYLTQVSPYVQHTYVGSNIYRINNWFIYQYCLYTEPIWDDYYTTPYDLFNDVYDTMDVNRVDPGIAYIEGRET